jgi:hypothetical protein
VNAAAFVGSAPNVERWRSTTHLHSELAERSCRRSSSDAGEQPRRLFKANCHVALFKRLSHHPGAFKTTVSTCGFFNCENVFLSKLDPTVSALVCSTCLDGSGDASGVGIAVDPTGHA